MENLVKKRRLCTRCTHSHALRALRGNAYIFLQLAVRLVAVAAIGLPFSAARAATFWEVLKSDHNTVEIMGLNAADDGFFLYGSEFLQFSVDPSSEQPSPATAPPATVPPAIAPKFKRRQLVLLKVSKNEEVLWRHTYSALPDAYEILSTAVSNTGSLHMVYTDHVGQDRLINPVLVQFDSLGQKRWSTRIFNPDTDILPSREQIANLDAIKLITTFENNCLLLFVTRSLADSGEQYRLHVNLYDRNGKLLSNKNISTNLYGHMFVINNQGAGHYSVISSNLSRDAALEAMLFKMPFTPKYKLLAINAKGQLLYVIDSMPELSNAWVNDVVNWHTDSLVLLGKRSNAWFSLIDARGKRLRTYENAEVNETSHNTGGEFDAAAQTLSDELIAADQETIYFFDKQLNWKSTYNISDIAIHSYTNSMLQQKLQDQIKVQQILALDKQQYLLFFQYGGRITKIKTP